MEKKYKIYKYTSPSGGVYIGQTKNSIEERAGLNGRNYMIHNKNKKTYAQTAIANAILKYGWDNFKKEILYDNLTKDEADELEKKLIKEERENGICYNIADGGSGAVVDANTTSIKMYSLDGKYIKTWDKVTDAEKFVGVKHGEANISACCQGRKKRAYGYIWRYIDSDIPVKSLTPYRSPICQFTKDGEYVNRYNTIAEASKSTGIYPSSIGNALRNWSKSAGGFIWKFEVECIKNNS